MEVQNPPMQTCQELEAGMASPVPSRETSVDCSEVSSNGDVQNPEHIDLRQEQVRGSEEPTPES